MKCRDVCRTLLIWSIWLPWLITIGPCHANDEVKQQKAAQSNAAQSDGGGNKEGGKLLVVLFLSEQCKDWTDNVRQALAPLKKRYADKVIFVELLVSPPEQLPKSREKARELRIAGFVDMVVDYTPEVGIFSEVLGKRKCVAEIVGPKPAAINEAKIKQALATAEQQPSGAVDSQSNKSSRSR